MTFRRNPLFTALAVALPLFLVACDDGSDGDPGPVGPQGPAGVQGTAGADATKITLSLAVLGRYETGEFDESAAEIVDYDPATQRVFVVNANSGRVDVLDASSPQNPTLVTSIDVAADVAQAIDGIADASALGAANSVSVSGDHMAVAIEADTKQANGYIAFYTTEGVFQSAVEAGALPDAVTFTPDGTKVIVANEGEPNGDYSVDPEGSVTIIDVSGGFADVSSANVTTVRFNNLTMADFQGPVRISAKSASIAQDLEPEYVTVSADSSRAWVSLQENNAFAEINLANNTLVKVWSLGFKNHAIPGNEFDASDRDGGVNLQNWPVFGTYMPDTIASFDVNGTTYLVSANEGDGREYLADATDADDCTAQGGFDFDDGDCFHYLDEIRVKDLTDNGATLSADLLDKLGTGYEDNANLGRLKVITTLGTTGTCASLGTTGQPEADCEYEALYAYGARSFSIWNTETGQQVYDSGNEFEVRTANRLGANFNANNDDNDFDSRSDDKGPEPEAIEVAEIQGQRFAFIGLERVGGIMVYNISNPEAAEFVTYINPRDFTVADVEADLALVGDMGPESIRFVAAEDSPTGEPMLIVGNEVSGTTTFFAVNVN
jgi:DNA-binding beta-propeller fold protein YncE